MQRLAIVVSGRVQGVGFRFFTRNAAGKQHCTGWVKNCPDGSVAMEVQGEPEALSAFQKAIGNGPVLAKVNDVSVNVLPTIDNEQTFKLLI